MLLTRLCMQRIATQIQGVPIQCIQYVQKEVLEAMRFDISKSSDERYKFMRTLTCRVQDRLDEVELQDFVRDMQFIREKNHTNPTTLKCAIFKLFNDYRILDLVPLCLRIELQELQPEYFHDEFDRMERDITNEYQCFVSHRAGLFQPQNRSLTDFIQYKRKYPRIQPNQQPLPEFTKLIDNNIIDRLLTNKEDIEILEIDDKQLLKNKLIMMKNKRMIGKEVVQISESEQKSPLYLKQVEDEIIIQSQRVCCYNLPYILDQEWKNEFKKDIENRFGKIESIEFIEYSNFKKQVDNTNNSQQDELLTLCENYSSQKSTMKLLQRVKNNKNKKLFKSYAIINFQDLQSKQNAISQDLRLFGFKFKDLIIKIDNADHKKLLYVNNFTKFSSIPSILQYLENALNTKFEPMDERATLQNPMICLVLKNFEETLRVKKILSELTFSRYQLNVFHFPDGLKYLGSKVTEHFTSNAAIEILEENMSNIRFDIDDNWKDKIEQTPIVPVKEIQNDFTIHPQLIEMIESSQSDEDFSLEVFGLVFDDEEQIYY